MKKNTLFIAAAVLLAALWLAAGCETDTPAKPEVISVKILRNGKEVTSAISAKQGTTVIFTADVEVKGKASQDVTWSVSGGKSRITKTNDNRASLKIADNETVGADLTVTAVSAENFRKLATATVNVQSKGGTPEDPIDGITISTEGNAMQVSQGATLQFSADGAEGVPVTWTISSGGRNGTSIDRESGLLRVGAQQPTGPLTIRASTDDPEVFVEITITVTTGTPSPSQPYTITYKRPFANGDVTGPVEAAQGTTVTLTLVPNPSDFRPSKLTVTRTPSGNVTLNGGGNTRTFTMPPSNVTVDAAFAEEGLFFKKDFDETPCSFFDKFEGNSLDLNKWAYQNGGGGWGNGEAQYYDPDNVTVSDGILRLEARVERRGGNNYTSGKLVTANGTDNEAIGQNGRMKHGQTYGRFEAKIRMTKAESGMWPAFWMMPVRNEYGGWPRSGEIDIMEMKGRLPRESSGTLHWKPQWGSWQSAYRGANQTYENNSDFTEWHVYSCLWDTTGISYLIDNKQFIRLPFGGSVYLNWYKGEKDENGTTSPIHSPDQGPFNKDFFIILNLAVNGNFDGNNRVRDSELPIAMEIEWVRVYTLENDPWDVAGTVPGRGFNN